jgi:hypothetical protein
VIHLELAVPSDWSRIDAVREAVGRSIEAVFGDLDLRDALAMVAAELLENAIKYGVGGVRLVVGCEAGRLVISVENAVDEGQGHARVLAELIAQVGALEPLAAYQAALERAFAAASEHSGLGLARIRYEGGCGLRCDTSAPGRVTVTATSAPLPA